MTLFPVRRPLFTVESGMHSWMQVRICRCAPQAANLPDCRERDNWMQRTGVKDKPVAAEKTQGVSGPSRRGARANLAGPRLSGRSAVVDSAPQPADATASASEGPSWEFSRIAMDAPARSDNRSGESCNGANNREQSHALKHAPPLTPLLIGSTSDPLE